MGTQPAAKTEGKGQRVLQPKAERDKNSGAQCHPELTLSALWWGSPQRHPWWPWAGMRRWKARTKMSEAGSFWTPMPWLKVQRLGPSEERWVPLCLNWHRLPLYLGLSLPPLHPPSSRTNAHVPTLLPSSTGTPHDPTPVSVVGRLEGFREKGHGSAPPPAPPAHGDSS